MEVDTVQFMTLEEMNEGIRSHEALNSVKYQKQSCTRSFGNDDWMSRSGNRYILWQADKKSTAWTPYIVVGRVVFECQHGPNRHQTATYRIKNSVRKRYNKFTPSKKIDCPARILCKEVVRFPSWEISSDNKLNQLRRTASASIRLALAGVTSMPDVERCIFVTFPTSAEHKCHGLEPREHPVVVRNRWLKDVKKQKLNTEVDVSSISHTAVETQCSDDSTSLIQPLYVFDSDSTVYTCQMTQTLRSFQQSGYLCDVTLVADDGHLKAHSVVVAAASTVFKSSLCLGERSREVSLVFPGVNIEFLEIAVNLMYTGKLAVPEKYVSENALSDLIARLKEFGITVPALSASSISAERCAIGSTVAEAADVVANSTNSCTATIEQIDQLEEKKDAKKLWKLPDNAAENQVLHEPSTYRGSSKTDAASTCSLCKQPIQQRTKSQNSQKSFNHWCKLCGRYFSCRTSLTRHLRKHADRRPFVCSKCGSCFSQKVVLTHHLSKCCGSDVSDERELHEANESSLSTLPVVQCASCYINFASFELLQRHECIQKEIQFYTCSECAETFASPIEMRSHYSETHL